MMMMMMMNQVHRRSVICYRNRLSSVFATRFCGRHNMMHCVGYPPPHQCTHMSGASAAAASQSLHTCGRWLHDDGSDEEIPVNDEEEKEVSLLKQKVSYWEQKVKDREEEVSYWEQKVSYWEQEVTKAHVAVQTANDSELERAEKSLAFATKMLEIAMKNRDAAVKMLEIDIKERDKDLDTAAVGFEFGSDAFERAISKESNALLERITFKDEDGNHTWRRKPDVEAFAKELVAIETENIDAGVQWTPLTKGIDVHSRLSKLRPSDTATLHRHQGLLTRYDSRVISQCILDDIRNSVDPTVSVITGVPGIGKTRTLVYMMQRLLRATNDKPAGKATGDSANIMYFDLQSEYAYLILRRGDVIRAWWAVDIEKANSGLFEHSSMHVFVDPNEDGAKFGRPPGAHLVLAASANDKHYHNLGKFAARPFGFMFYMPMWSEAEMLAAREKIAPDISAEYVKARVEVVGGAPRYVFDGGEFNDRMGLMENAANEISKTLVYQVLEDVRLEDSPTVSGRLFTFTRHADLERKPSMEEIKDMMSKTLKEMHRVEPNGEHVLRWPHCVREVSTISPHAEQLITKRFGDDMFEGMTDNKTKMSIAKMFELFHCMRLVKEGETFTCIQMKVKNATDAMESEKALVERGVTFMKAGDHVKCLSEEATWSALDQQFINGSSSGASSTAASPTLIQPPTGMPLIDFALGRDVFQVTHSKKHRVTAAGARQLVEIAKKHGTKIRFYWMVPTTSCVYKTWCNKRHGIIPDRVKEDPKKVKEDAKNVKEETNTLEDEWFANVEQWVVEVKDTRDK